ncbi:Putative transposase of IS4/5 family [Streptomyces sp. ScaeMP-6W]|nr:Putative transposase of IS4/5 family [Streptomyces sp. ScaeMP-6W]
MFQSILFVLHTGISWEHLPQELGFGSGMTCWRRLAEWTDARVWPRFRRLQIRWEIHEAFLTLGCALICWRRLAAVQRRHS